MDEKSLKKIISNTNKEQISDKETYFTLDEIKTVIMNTFLNFRCDVFGEYEPTKVSVITHRFREEIEGKLVDYAKSRNDDNASCRGCLSDKSECERCIDNCIYNNIPKHSRYKYYEPVCPYNHMSCTNDPGYIKYYEPDKFKELYGDISPFEALVDCLICFEKDKEKCSNYRTNME